MRNWKIRTKLFVAFSVIILLFGLVSFYSINAATGNKERVEEIDQEILADALTLIALQTDVIQIQQWLSDISATQAYEGFDDGFMEAEKYFQAANSKLDFLIKAHEERNEEEMHAKLNATRQRLADYYRMGVKMANAYIEGGPEKGNPMMEEFDPFAEALTTDLEVFVNMHKGKIEDTFSELNGTFDTSILTNVVAVIIAVLISIIFGVLVTNSISTPLKEATTISNLKSR